jgi:hypothetical protein
MKHSNILKAAVIALFFCLQFGNAFSQLNPLTIGSITAGDSIVIYYDVTINKDCGCTEIVNQGIVSGSNFTSFNTNDPKTAAPNDPTITILNMFPLPVTFYELSAVPNATGIKVSWKVGHESDMIKYEVERSNNGNQFAKIGEVAALNRASGFIYSFQDANPENGVNFYRLKLIDKDASTKYSNIVRVNLTGKHEAIRIYPNPVVQKQITLELNNLEKGKFVVTVYNAAGLAVYKTEILHTGGSLSKSIYLPAILSKGMYNVQVKNEKAVLNKLIMLE